ncbi:hypothetical protein PM082_010183 [Marasmius tenuissimus]|nr:hypothetical protein PM082_010183 [Marasmius tenuissimus]
MSPYDSLLDRKLLDNGLTRFTLNGGGKVWLAWNWDAYRAWMSQALSIFHARGISLEDDLSVYNLVHHYAWLEGDLSDSEAKHQRRSQQPIYLFVRPPPLDHPDGDTSPVHFWSFDEDGQFPLPHNVCDNLGLPFQLSFHIHYYSQSWSNDNYALIHQYQLSRGFDPSTPDFARHVGFDNIYQHVNDSDRFERLQDSPLEDSPSTPPSDFPATPTHPSGSATPLVARKCTGSRSRIPVPVGGFKHFGRRRRDP